MSLTTVSGSHLTNFKLDYSQGDYLSQLPAPYSTSIFTLLNIRELLTCRLVSKRWNTLSSADEVWKSKGFAFQEVKNSKESSKQKIPSLFQRFLQSKLDERLEKTLKLEKSALEIDVSYLSIMRYSNKHQDIPSSDSSEMHEIDIECEKMKSINELKHFQEHKPERHEQAKIEFHHLILLQKDNLASLESLKQKAEVLNNKYDDRFFLDELSFIISQNEKSKQKNDLSHSPDLLIDMSQGKAKKPEIEEESDINSETGVKEEKNLELKATDSLSGKSMPSSIMRNNTPFFINNRA